MRKIIPYLAIILSMLIWAGSGIAVKAALVVLSPLQLVVTRFSMAVVLMLTIGLCSSSLQGIRKGDWWLFLLAGFFQPFLYFILETYTYRCFATPTMAEAFLSTSPLIAPILAYWLLKEEVTKYNIWGIIISTTGMLLLVLAGAQSFSIGSPWGIPLALITMLSSVGYVLLLKRIPEHYNALTIVFWTQLIGLCLFIPTWGIAEGGQLPNFAWNNIEVRNAWTGVGYLAVLSSVAAFILYCYGVRILGVTKGNAFNNIRPVFTAIIMWLLMDEHLPCGKLVGIGIIVLGLFICQKKNIQ